MLAVDAAVATVPSPAFVLLNTNNKVGAPFSLH